MSWADNQIKKLQAGVTVQFRPKGNSMKGRINNGDLITVSPNIANLEVGDAVLCKVKGNHYVHLIKAIKDEQFLIGNNRGGTNGWITKNAIFGKVTQVER